MISRTTTISVAALLLASAGAASAFPATATADLNVRSGPGTGYSIVDQLGAGDTVEIVATRGSWYQTAEGGWASGNYLDAEGSAAVEGPGYEVVDTYGSPSFYYGSNPYYWDDAGFYFYIDSGRRHRVGWDWFRSRNDRDFRWSNTRHRRDFESRRGQWDGNRSAVQSDGDSRDGDARRANRREERIEQRVERSDGQNVRSGRASASEGGGNVDRRRSRSDDGDRIDGQGPWLPGAGDRN